jgi:hypothetical protein
MSGLSGFGLNALTLLWVVFMFVVSFTFSMAVLVFVLTRLPSTYFRGPRSPRFWAERHPMVRWAGLAGKNLLGVLLVLLGIFLSLPAIPGQGLLTILIGIMLLNFPGKRRLEQRLVSRPQVLRAINWLRDRFGRSPLELDSAMAHAHAKPRGTADLRSLTREGRTGSSGSNCFH